MAQNIDNEMKEVQPTSIQFSMFTREEIVMLSVKKISTSLTFDALGHPLLGGLYDPALGPLNDRSEPCKTCFKNVYNCPGHFGHIELPVDVINPLFYNTIRMILRICCTYCTMLQIPVNIKQILSLQMKLLHAGFVIEAQELANYMDILVEEIEEKEDDAATATSAQRYLKKYIKLAKSGSVMTSNNKNIESVRNSFVSSILKSIVLKTRKNCLFCKQSIKKITATYQKIMIHENEDGTVSKTERRMIMPDELQRLLRQIWNCDRETMISLIPLLKDLKSEFPTDVMFIKYVTVVPPLTRPISYMGDTMAEHPQTVLYKGIIETSLVIRTIIKVLQNESDLDSLDAQARNVYNQQAGESVFEKFHSAWQELQGLIDQIMNKEISRTSNTNRCDGIKQIIEKKSGIIRQHMMGKRVNFAARSVITPDPNLNINEIGIPEVFAKQLTYPVSVTTWNVEQLRKMILNGPNKHPGAVMVESENGKTIKIPNDINIQKSIAKRLLVSDKKHNKQPGVKRVHRHLLTGDILLLNRQPTLHKPSIMAHTARILKGEKTLRLHYANCKAYNADFDGDEMNAHFPQNELARSEAYNIVNVCNQYLVPKDGTPLSGLIQDHVISGVKLSIRGKFFTKADYNQLVFSALNHKLGQLILLPPAIWKPAPMWSGKQVISTVIINSIPKGRSRLNLIGKAKINAKAWQREKPAPIWKAGGTPFKNDKLMSEAEVVIREGELLSGVLDKTHYGATPYGLIHCVFELYGGEHSNMLLSALAKLFTTFLQREGFTLGVKDILVVPKADLLRRQFVDEARQIGRLVAAEAIGLKKNADNEEIKSKIEESYANNPKFRMILDRQYKTALDSYNNNINRACIPAGLVSRFPDNNLQLMVESGAKGSMVNCMQISCLLGQIELEGKRPPVMISGRSLPSFPPYETEPRAGGFIDGRFMTGIQPQEFFFHCMAGREGLIDTAVKTSRSGYLQRCLVKHLEGLTVGYDLTVRDSDNSVVQFFYGEDGMDVCKTQFLKKQQLRFLEENKHIIIDKEREKILNISENEEQIIQHKKAIKSWKKKFGSPLVKTLKRKSLKDSPKPDVCPDPVVSKYQPDHYPGVINEFLEELVSDYLNKRTSFKKSFTDMIKIKAIETMCAPGEPVGMLAAQSIGEPSTQMTLNTFHFAGRGEMNVTLGIPRLREILMCASKEIKTPNMEIPIKAEIQPDMAKKLCKRFTRVTLTNVLEKIHVNKRLNVVTRKQEYTLRFHFLPPDLYKSEYYVKPKDILKYMEKYYFTNMFQAFSKVDNLKIKMLNVTEEKSTTTPSEKLPNLDEDANSESEIENEEESNFKRKKFDDSNSEPEQSDDEISLNDNEKNLLETKNNLNEDEIKSDIIHCSKVVNSLRYAQNYDFDKENKRWCEIKFALPCTTKNIDITAILRDVADKSIIWETPNIKRAITYTDNSGSLIFRTDGININEMFKYINFLDLNRLYTNDIHAMAQTYGIEAAARVIVKEIKDVFNVYGITVNSRHLSLIADYMTYDGIFQPLSRKGMENGASPLQQMSFESSLVFLRNAVTNGKVDMLKTPSSCLMVGWPCRGGTGAIDLVVNDIC